MRSHRRPFVGFTAILVFLTLAPAAAADSVLDQSFLGFVQGTGGGLYAQTYTAGVTGSLAGINLQLFFCSICGTGPVTIEIRSVASGVPSSTVLGSVTFPTFQSIDISQLIVFPQAIAQVAGVEYAIVISGGPTAYAGAGYAGGGLFNSNDNGATWQVGVVGSGDPGDIQFQTHVNPVPEPGTLFLVGMGMAAAGLRKRLTKVRNFHFSEAPKF